MGKVRVLALDASMNRTGWAVLAGEPADPNSYFTEASGPWSVDEDWPRGRKFKSLLLRTREKIRGEKPDLVAVEGFGGVDRNPNRSLAALSALAAARAMVEVAACEADVPCVLIDAGLIKASLCVTQNGRPNRVAKKPEVHWALDKLGLYRGNPKVDIDVADAVAVGYCCLRLIASGEIKL